MNQTGNKIDRIIQLSDVKNCIGAGNYYHKFRGAIADIKDLKEGKDMLFALRRDCERYSEMYPREVDEMHETYKLLKKKCLEAMQELKQEELENEQYYQYWRRAGLFESNMAIGR